MKLSVEKSSDLSGSRPRRGEATRAVVFDVACACAVSAIVAQIFNWRLVVSDTLPTGGDHPAHPYLMASLRQAIFEHGSIVHYNYGFWGGFELFQFYFPFAYVLGAVLSLIVPLNVAYKLVVVSGVLVFPLAFYLLGRVIGLTRSGAIVGSISSVCYLFTEAHTMWGGNMRSSVAGMFGNAWGLNLLILSMAAIIRYYRDTTDRGSRANFPILLPLLLASAALSHFYSLVAAALFCLSLAVVALWEFCRCRESLRPTVMLGLGGVAAIPLFAWWFIPLVVYKRYSSEFGGNWQIWLGDTLTPAEKALAFIVFFGAVEAALRDTNRRVLALGVTFFALSFAAYGSTLVLSSAAFSNIRLWPGLYLSLYVLLLVVLESGLRRRSPSIWPLLFAMAASLPSNESLRATRLGFELVMSGVPGAPGSRELMQLVSRLQNEKPTRVSFESDARNHETLSSIRTFEALPYLTHHEIVEGGIVNSAALAGIPYSLQCLSSITCAGWPRGTLVPERNTARAIEMMRGLGVRFHIASSDEMRSEFRNTPGASSVWSGRFFELFEIADSGAMVEVYDGPPVAVIAEDQNTLFPALARLDAPQDSLFVAVDDAASLERGWTLTAPRRLLQYYYDRWEHGTRPFERGVGVDQRGWINTFLMPHGCADTPALDQVPTFSIGDRGLFADHFFQPSEREKRCVLVPFTAEQEGEYSLTLVTRGYDASQNGLPLKEGGQQLRLPRTAADGEAETFVLLRPNAEPMQYAFVRGEPSTSLRSRVSDRAAPGEGEVKLPPRITEQCGGRVEKRFHELVLHTTCPGKPHLVKYNYFPKWKSEVPLFRGSFGYIVLTPKGETTVIRHRRSGWEDVLVALGALTAVGLFAAGVRRGVRRNPTSNAPRPSE